MEEDMLDGWLSDDDGGRYRKSLDDELDLPPPMKKWGGAASAAAGLSSGL
jgi:hypothetical protein